MRMAKVSLNKRNSVNSRVEVIIPEPQPLEDDTFDDDDDGDSDEDANFPIDDHHTELNLEKVESLLGIPLSSKAVLSSSGGSGGSSSELIIKPSRKLVAGKRKSEEKQIEAQIASSSSGRSSRGKVPKVTLKIGPGNPARHGMKVRSSNRHSIGTTNGNTSVSDSTSHQQVASGGPLTPRTPGTPSDHGANTPNPPTPGNTNSGSMVNSPHQYVTITVDGEGGVSNEGGVSVGGSSSYVTYVEGSTDHSSLYAVAAAAAANGQTMTYPVYTSSDSGSMYSAGGGQYYASGSGTQGVNYAQDINEERDDGMGNGSMDALGSADFSMLSNGSGSSSMISSSPEIDTQHQHHHQHASLDGGVYMVPASSGNNNNSGTSEGEGPANLSHATRVSPATNNKRKRSHPPALKPMIQTPLKEDDESEDDSDDEDGYNDEGSGDQSGALEDGFISSFLSKSEMNALANMYPIGKINEQLGSDFQSKNCPDTVQWLLDNYETAEGVSLPRSTLYYHYLRHCSDNKLDPVNAASFGKLIRSVFLGLRTRRLGTRGNSKYHYYGIRLKPTSALNHLPEDFPFPSGNGNQNRNTTSTAHNNPVASTSCVGSVNKRLKTVKPEGYDASHSNGFTVGESVGVQQYLGDPNGALEDFPDLDMEVEMPEGLAEDDLLIFRSLYREHCEALLEALGSFQLGQIEALWRFFWRTSDGQAVESSADYEKILPKSKLMLLCQMKAVQDFVKDADYGFYQKMAGILLPDVLRPIPSTMTQAIRNCAKTLENWLTSAMLGYPEEMVVIKVTVVSALAQTLRRYTSLNHLAQAARAVLQNQNQITQMLSDLNRVDFHNVEEQASWVCGCDGDLVPNLEQDFKATLAQQQSLEQWASWLESVVERVLRPHINTPRFVQAARHFLLKWSFYSSLIIRDLTLRSAASFGSFHLLRLLYDEYMFYLVEHRVAQVSGIVPIAVIGKKSMDPSFNSLALSNSNLSTISGSPISQVSVGGQNNTVSSGSNPIGSLSSSPPSEGQGIITHTNNNTTSSSYGQGTVKSEFKRVKNFLVS